MTALLCQAATGATRQPSPSHSLTTRKLPATSFHQLPNNASPVRHSSHPIHHATHITLWVRTASLTPTPPRPNCTNATSVTTNAMPRPPSPPHHLDTVLHPTGVPQPDHLPNNTCHPHLILHTTLHTNPQITITLTPHVTLNLPPRPTPHAPPPHHHPVSPQVMDPHLMRGRGAGRRLLGATAAT